MAKRTALVSYASVPFTPALTAALVAPCLTCDPHGTPASPSHQARRGEETGRLPKSKRVTRVEPECLTHPH